MLRYAILSVFLLCGCVSGWVAPDDFVYMPIHAGGYEIASWQKITDDSSVIHIYLEGDGRAFDGRGVPTRDPTPHGTFMRDLAMSDTAPNVVYIARPCQFIMSDICRVSDWTDGRFSPQIIDAMANAIRYVAPARPVVLIGYSGGAMVSGLVILQNSDIDVRQWITIAGVLNHTEWSEYFGDAPLDKSLDMTVLPDVPQIHYVGTDDDTVPYELTTRIADYDDIIVVPNATHGDFGNLQIDFFE